MEEVTGMAIKSAKAKSRRWLWSILILVALVAGIGGAAIALRGPSSEKYLADGQKQLASGELRSAVINLRNAVRTDPNNIDARLALAEVSLRIGDAAAAEKEVKVARELGAPEERYLDPLAQSLFGQAKFDDILREIAPGTREQKVEAVVRLWRGYAYLGKRDINLAGRSFGEALQVNPEEARAHVGLARIAIEQSDQRKAEEEIDRALGLNGDLSEALAMKGELQRLSGRKEEARASFDAALKGDSRNVLALIGRAVLALDERRNDDAERDSRAALAVQPGHPIANYVFALLNARKNELKTASERLERLGPGISTYPPNLYLLAALHYRLQQFGQAEAGFERYLALVPRDIRARQLLAELYMRRNANERAIEVLKLAVDTGVEDPATFGLLAAAYLRDRQFQESSKWFDRAAALPHTDVRQQLQIAYGRMQLGQSTEAVKELESALEQDPNSVQARLALALAHMRAGEHDKALAVARDLQARQPDSPVPHNVMGTIHVARNAMPEARAAFEEAIRVKPDFTPARLNLATIDARTGQQEKAAQGFRSVLEATPNSIEAHVGLAQLSISGNRMAEAQSWLEKARAIDPKALRPSLALIDLYMRDGKPDRAIQVARDLQSRLPDNAVALDSLARTQLAVGETASAIQTFRQVVALTPRIAEAHYRLGKALQQARDQQGATSAFRQALAVDSNYAPALLELIEVELRANRRDAAEKMATEWSRARPALTAGHVILGDTLSRVGKHAEAVEAYRTAQARQPSSPIVTRLSGALARSGENEKAIKTLQDWVETRPEDNVARFALADLYLSLQRKDEALVHYELLLKSEPDNALLLNNVAWILGERGDGRALGLAERAFKLAPNSAFVEDTLGYLLMQQGEVKRGVEHLRSARVKAPTSGEIAYHLALGLVKLGEREEAKAVLREAMAGQDSFNQRSNAEQLLKELGG